MGHLQASQSQLSLPRGQSELLSDEDRMGLFAARKMAVEEHNKNAHSPFRRTVSVFADMVRAQLKRCTT